VSFDKGFNLRASPTGGGVTDGPNETYVLSSDAYPTTRNGVTFGWTTAPDGDSEFGPTVDRRLTGYNYKQNTGTQAVFRIDLPSSGSYAISIALGGHVGRAYQYVQVSDGATPVLTIDDSNGTAADHWDDATGADLDATSWPAGEAPVTVALSGSTLNIALGSPAAQSDFSTLAHVFVSLVAAPPAPPRVAPPTIVDRVARSMVLGVLATHTVIGVHALRGAPARTKVAPIVVRQTKITPPPVKTRTLPYRLQGAPKKIPRPFPEVFLTRKPLPITRSVQLAHVLRGAPQRKPFPVADVYETRTPPPATRSYISKRFFKAGAKQSLPDPALNLVRVPLPIVRVFKTASIAGETAARGPFRMPDIELYRTPLPRIRSIVSQTYFHRPPTGNGAPVTAMFEAPAPRTRSFVARRPSAYTLAPPRPFPNIELVRSLKPVTRSYVGIANPRAAASRAHPIVVTVRVPLPRTDSLSGPQGKWYTASHERWTRPVVASLRIVPPAVHLVVLDYLIPNPLFTISLAIAVNNGKVVLRTENNATVTLTTSE
jgi:hypothetical protein